MIALICRLFGHRWAWYTIKWSTGEVTAEDRCKRCGETLESAAS